MRFIYGNKSYKTYENIIPEFYHCGIITYTLEDTQDNIIWLINSEKSYNEVRDYYGNE